MVNLKDNFRNWLIRQGLSEKTVTGRHGTAYEYNTRKYPETERCGEN